MLPIRLHVLGWLPRHVELSLCSGATGKLCKRVVRLGDGGGNGRALFSGILRRGWSSGLVAMDVQELQPCWLYHPTWNNAIDRAQRRCISGEDGVFAFVAKLQNVANSLQDTGCILAVRGTVSAANWRRNFQFLEVHTQQASDSLLGNTCASCKVHTGFLQVWLSLKTGNGSDVGVLDRLEEIGCGMGSGHPVFITGHSLGAAVATLAAYDLKMQGFDVGRSYNFNSPRVVNREFAAHFESLFDGSVSQFRVTHLRDPVSQLPPTWLGSLNYRHVGAEVFFYPSWTMTEFSICEDPEDETHICSHRYRLAGTILNTKLFADHCSTTMISNSGAFCTWPEFCRVGL